MMDRGGDHDAATTELFANPAIASTPAGEASKLIRMDGGYLLGFGPRTAGAIRDLAVALYGDAGHGLSGGWCDQSIAGAAGMMAAQPRATARRARGSSSCCCASGLPLTVLLSPDVRRLRCVGRRRRPRLAVRRCAGDDALSPATA